ncbi:MAG: hypothetical protein A2868_03750 [Candidatus Levybacteria bacterium RIFCSPHIGHO2_01_FULL_40_15b]|nr:MAG: hypothetical protein A2868_03750 [Candidatus Levybacteria bacterium RIFCSPHIGHO2_01_FULL_40_15b]
MTVYYDPAFLTRLKSINVRILNNFKKKIVLFARDPNNSELNNHKLKKEWIGHRSIDITSDYRAIYIEKQVGEETVAYFVDIGTHNELYF